MSAAAKTTIRIPTTGSTTGSATGTGRRLSRATDGRPAAPVRIVHLGAGNFFRAHQAWYTEHAADADAWGIAAFTGRSAAGAQALAAADGLYTLLVRGPEGDRPEVVASLARVRSSADPQDWRETFLEPGLAVVTTTVTEAGYRRAADGHLDLGDPQVAADLAALRRDGDRAAVGTAPAKLLVGLLARRAAGLGPVALVPCDNVPDNAGMLRRVLADLAREAVPQSLGWLADEVGYVTTMVDRITPRTTDEDRADLLRDTGIDDPACVVTEPFSEWVLAGAFPAGRPAWEAAGARFVDDVEPWERRKLLLLNGSHSLMAYAATLRGHATVQEAIADPVVLGWVEQWWDGACRHLALPSTELAAYRAALLERYRNPRIRHLLAQIAADGSQKLPIRVLPVIRAARAQGDLPLGATRVLAAWTLHLRGAGAPVTDPGAGALREAVRATDLPDAVSAVLRFLDCADGEVERAVLEQARALDPLG